MVKSTRHIQAFFLGKLDYFSSIDLQEKINLEIQENKKEDQILFLEYDNVVTFGSQEKISDEEIKKLNSDNRNILFSSSSPTTESLSSTFFPLGIRGDEGFPIFNWSFRYIRPKTSQ